LMLGMWDSNEEMTAIVNAAHELTLSVTSLELA
jgi:hypothetical protein